MSTLIARPAIKRRGKRLSQRMHPNSLAAIIPYQYPKGVNGHQGGYSLKECLQHKMDKPLTKPPDDAPVRELLVYSTIEGAILREPTPLKEVWDRVDGKLTGDEHGDTNIQIIIVSNVPRPTLLLQEDGNPTQP